MIYFERKELRMLPDSNLNNLVNLINKVKTYPCFDEANTKSNIITPILQALHWNVNSSFEVVREYPLGEGRVDYALKVVDDIKVLIEAKKMKENLDNYEDQIRKYAIENVSLFILSNGTRWQFYTWLKKGIGIHNFFNIDFHMAETKIIAEELYNILSKESIISNISYNYIRNIIAKDQSKYSLYAAIIEVWHNILEEPSPLLCDLIIGEVNKAFNISTQREDVEKILNDYNMEIKKIRWDIKHAKESVSSLNLYSDKDLEKLKLNILRLSEKKNTKELNLSDIMRQVAWFMDKKKLEHYLPILSEIGLIKIDGRNIIIIK